MCKIPYNISEYWKLQNVHILYFFLLLSVWVYGESACFVLLMLEPSLTPLVFLHVKFLDNIKNQLFRECITFKNSEFHYYLLFVKGYNHWPESVIRYWWQDKFIMWYSKITAVVILIQEQITIDHGHTRHLIFFASLKFKFLKLRACFIATRLKLDQTDTR